MANAPTDRRSRGHRRITLPQQFLLGERVAPHLGAAPVPFQVGFRDTLAYLGRFLLRGVLRGGVRRWNHVARSLVPVLLRPRLVPFVILNWVYGIAIQEFVREHLNQHAVSEPSVGGDRVVEVLEASAHRVPAVLGLRASPR